MDATTAATPVATTAHPTPTATASPTAPAATASPTAPAPTTSTPTTPTSPTAHRTHRLSLLAALLAAAVVLTGCGAGDDASAEVGASPAPRSSDAPSERSTRDAAGDRDDEPGAPSVAPDAPEHELARVARATDHLDVLAAPGSAEVTHELDATTDFDSPRALLVVDERDGWLEVLLPVRPNGTTGWIAAGDVEVVEVDLAVEVDLEERTLTVSEAGEQVLTTDVAIGDPDHPTPTGTFYVTDKLDTGDAQGPYGPYALGLSARSEVLTEFAGGDGQVGIHGTNDPASIGEAVSHGCIRVDNDVIVELAGLLPLGTPVTVS